MSRKPDQPLETYGFLSDCHSAALVAADGSVDWWCLPRFDSPSVFGALLDPDAGHWRITPHGEDVQYEQQRSQDSLTLTTTMSTARGRVTVHDALALTPGARGHDIGLRTPHTLLRVVEVVEGEADLDVEISPRPEYGLTTPRWRVDDGRWYLRAGPVGLRLTCDVELTAAHGDLVGRVHGRQGDRFQFALAYDPPYESVLPLAMSPFEALQETRQAWRSWAALHTGYQGLYADQVRRSSLVLQGLTYQKSGAVVAAATTSLPEKIGGSLNWDYRFTWLRDVSLTMQALWVGACPHEAGRFFEWLAGAIGELGDKPLQIVYGVEGERDLSEHELAHLRGWRDSRPVRVGNDAWKQRQLDVLGEVLFAARLLREQLTFPEQVREMLRALAEQAAKDWGQPDAGMWESRDEPRHYVSAKVICWVALDAAIELADDIGASDRVEGWRRTAEEIREVVLEQAWSESGRFLAGALGSDQLDASVLLLPLLGFLPADHPKMSATIDAVRRELADGWLVYRWQGDTNPFLICSFWLVECLALLGRVDEATEGFERLLQLSGPGGLFSEEVRPDGTMVGNIPQAFSHVGLINAAWRLTDATGGSDRGTPAVENETAQPAAPSAEQGS
jgi:GH15 family glucan-1,4-alpha-glucosidase